jgi:hypothetical protein
MSFWVSFIVAVLAFFLFVIWLDFQLNQNDDATTIGQFKKFQDSFNNKGRK